ncbi:MAG: chorismate-binding protein, partial [Phenylobacterium sp.]|nr:chorismate-binding protein [Phenylobacterium sp.]
MAPPLPSLPWRYPLDAFHLLRDTPFALLILGDGEKGRWSAIFAHPRSQEQAAGAGEALARARSWLESPGQTPPAPETAPFHPGIAGILGYDAGLPGAGPPSALGLYDRVLVFDHEARAVHMIETPNVPPEGRDALLALLESPPPPPPLPGAGQVEDVEPREAFGGKVEAVRARIACGEFYQANISRRFEGRLGDGDHPFDLFRRLARSSPAAFAAYLRLPGCAIVSNSPERLVRVRNTPEGRLALTSPIKGTAPRGHTPEADALNARGLLASEKDRAENLMIVDL